MRRTSLIHLRRSCFVLALALAVSFAGPAEAVKVWDFSTLSYIVPGWFVKPGSPAGETVVTVDGSDPYNTEIKVGVSSFGSVQTDTQTSAIYGAGAYLSANGGAGYRVEFSTQVYGWDSYDAIGTPGINGYWDVFAVNLNQYGGYYWTQVNGGGGLLGDPIVTPDPAGECVGTAGVATLASSTGPCLAATANPLGGETWAWGALDYATNTFEGNTGSYTLTLAGSGLYGYYLSVVLDTATTPHADAYYPSFGAFNPLSEVPPPTLVPEPGTLLLLGSGLAGLGAWTRRRAPVI